MRQEGPKIVYLGDLQVKPEVATHHLEWMADYIADKKPDVIVQGGDWFDFPSLCSYDYGKKAHEGRRYQDDIAAGRASRERFERRLKKRRFAPRRKVFTRGNHEERVNRAIEEDAKLDGKLDLRDMGFEEDGWEHIPFLQPIMVHNIYFSHFFPLNANGQVTQTKNGCPNAKVQGERVKKSCVAGHMQGLDVKNISGPFGIIKSVILGSSYLHSEKYLSPMGNNHWRGILVLNDIRPDGYFDVIEVSLDYLERKYG